MGFVGSACRTSRATRPMAWAALVVATVAGAGRPPPEPGDDRTFRPTVLIRKGTAQGSGTVIASTAGETLVLTAAHVVEGPGALVVELHRYNFGLERDEPRSSGAVPWPLAVAAEAVAADTAADVAVVRFRRMPALPFVARLASEADWPARGSVVTSIGIDRGTRLSAWTTRVAEVDRFAIEGSGGERLFLVTVRAPEHGRSGGGLFLDDGALVGVCIGRAEMVKGRRSGIFASGASIRHLLRAHSLDARATPRGTPVPPRRAPVAATRARRPP